MKKLFNILTIVLLTVFQPSFGQVKLLQDSLKKESRKVFIPSGLNISVTIYTDLAEPFDRSSAATGVNGQRVMVGCGPMKSIGKFTEIKHAIFTVDEMKYLAANRCFLEMVIYSTGKIVSASFTFIDHDPTVDVKKLIEFSKQIKENLSFKMEYYDEIVNPGYYLVSIRAFPEYEVKKRK